MRFLHILFFLLFMILFSCKQGKKDLMLGTWKGSKFENPDMDTFFMKSQQYIDTIGKNNNMRTNWELYGVTNVDSLRGVLQKQHDSAKSMQMGAVLNTIFTVKKDSIAVISFNGSIDTSKWYIENDHFLVMEEMTGTEKGSKSKMELVTLTAQEMVIKFEQESSSSKVTFVKANK